MQLCFRFIADSARFRSAWRSLAILVVMALLAGMGAEAADLTFSYTDPAGDQTGQIDVTQMVFVFDNTNGSYKITITTTEANPFIGLFRININLYNPDVSPTVSYFGDTVNDFTLTDAATTLILTGTNPNLVYWNAGDRVVTSTLALNQNPPGSTFFRSSVLDDPFDNYLTNEDSIAFGVGLGIALIRPLTAQDAAELIRTDVQLLMESGSLTPDQAAGLMDKLNEVIISLNQARKNASCGQSGAFINQVNAFVRSGVLTVEQGQELIEAADEMRAMIGCG
jgi:hypothetical protein